MAEKGLTSSMRECQYVHVRKILEHSSFNQNTVFCGASLRTYDSFAALHCRASAASGPQHYYGVRLTARVL